MVIAILFGCAITMFLLAGSASGQELQRRVGPPTPSFHEATCGEQLDAVRFQMWQVSIQEAHLYWDEAAFAGSLHDSKGRKELTKRGDYFFKRASDTLDTKDLTPSFNSCRVGNIKELLITLAIWQREYLLDKQPAIAENP